MWGELPYTISTLVGLTTLNLTGNKFSQQLPEVAHTEEGRGDSTVL